MTIDGWRNNIKLNKDAFTQTYGGYYIHLNCFPLKMAWQVGTNVQSLLTYASKGNINNCTQIPFTQIYKAAINYITPLVHQGQDCQL